MAWSELCTSDDIERHNEERYIPVNIVDEKSAQIIGMLMMYVEEDKDYLIVRWFNLRNSIYEKYSIESVAETMVDFVKTFAIENWYKRVYTLGSSWQHLVSNSTDLTKEIRKITSYNEWKPDYKKQEKFEWWRIDQWNWFTVKNLYMLLDL